MSIVFQDTWLIPSLFINYMYMYGVHVMDTSHSFRSGLFGLLLLLGVLRYMYIEKKLSECINVQK